MTKKKQQKLKGARKSMILSLRIPVYRATRLAGMSFLQTEPVFSGF